MKVGRKDGGAMNIFIEGGKVEQVSKFKYLGRQITKDGRTETEVKARIGMEKAAFNKRKELLKRKINRELKERIVNIVIQSVYGIVCTRNMDLAERGDEAHQRSGDVVVEENGENKLDREED